MKRNRKVWRALLVLSVVALGVTGAATANGDGDVILNEGDSLVQVIVPNKAAAYDLQRRAEDFGVEFNDHYLGRNDDGSYTVTVFASEGELQALAEAGYQIGQTLEGPDSAEADLAEMNSARAAEARSSKAALGDPPVIADDDELVILRADYFENYAGRYLSVEAKDRLGGSTPSGADYIGPAVSVSWNTGGGTAIDQGPRVMNTNIDPDTTPDTYIEHRILIRIGNIGEGPRCAVADPHRLEHRSVARGRRLRLAGRRPPAARARLPVGLHDALHGPDRGPRALPAARR